MNRSMPTRCADGLKYSLNVVNRRDAACGPTHSRAATAGAASALQAGVLAGVAFRGVNPPGDLAAAKRELAHLSGLAAEHVQRRLERVNGELELASVLFTRDAALPAQRAANAERPTNRR